MYEDKAFNEITEYCESDVINTYLIYLSHQLLNREIDISQKQEYFDKLNACLQEHNPNHLALIEKS